MEKKKLISVVKPLIAAALLFGSSGGVAWGQAYIGTNMSGSANVNNEFGAGESAVITNGLITTPHNHALSTPPNTIWLGSRQASGKNIVIIAITQMDIIRIGCIEGQLDLIKQILQRVMVAIRRIL